jgi:hypothetical protein
MTTAEWRTCIEFQIAARPAQLNAMQYQGKTWKSISKPVLMLCDGGGEYVVKYFHEPRMLVNDQVVGILGAAMGAPVPEVRLVNMPAALVTSDKALAHIPPGIWHGSQYLADVSDDKEAFAHQNVAENRVRFSILAAMYGHTLAQDHQFLYKKQPPELVFSHDHGHFFPSGPNWTASGLQGAPAAVPDPEIIRRCALTQEEVHTAIAALRGVTNAIIAGAVARPLDSWGLTMDDRIALASYLEKRRDELLAQLPAPAAVAGGNP